MSEEGQLERYMRCMDASRRRPWTGRAPDEAMMEAEEGAAQEWSFTAATGCLLAFLFDKGAEDWERVALRAAALLKRYAMDRAARMVMPDFPMFTGWGLEEFFKLVGSDGAGIMGKVLRWFYRESGPDALRRGTERVYLVASLVDPQLLKLGPMSQAGAGEKQMGFAEMAMAFGELARDGAGRRDATALARARSRWSAKARKLVRVAMEMKGAWRGADFFGKMPETREKYRKAAKGNRNGAGRHEKRIGK